MWQLVQVLDIAGHTVPVNAAGTMAQVPPSLTLTITEARLKLPAASLTVRVTLYWPGSTKVCSTDWPDLTALLSLMSHSNEAMLPFGSIAMNVTASGAGPFGSDIAVGVAEIFGLSEGPGVEDDPGVPPPQAASVNAANTTREPYKALPNLALIPEVTSVSMLVLPVPPLTGSALCRRGPPEKIGETDEAPVPCCIPDGRCEGFRL